MYVYIYIYIHKCIRKFAIAERNSRAEQRFLQQWEGQHSRITSFMECGGKHLGNKFPSLRNRLERVFDRGYDALSCRRFPLEIDTPVESLKPPSPANFAVVKLRGQKEAPVISFEHELVSC